MSGAENQSSRKWLVIAFQALAAGLFGLHLYVRSLPATPTPLPAPTDAESFWWGFWPATYVPKTGVWVGGLLLSACIGAYWISLLRLGTNSIRTMDEKSRPVGRLPIRSFTFLILAIVSLALIVASLAFPIAHTRWGDAYMLSKAIAWPDPALRLTHSWQAPLDVYLHSQIWLLVHERFGWRDAIPVYRLLSPLAGTLFMLIVLTMSRDERLAPPWLTYALLVSLGLIQLFFGYVENYSFAVVGVLVYLWFGIGALRGERPIWPAAAALAVTMAIHPSTLVLLPSLFVAGLCVAHGDTDGNQSRLRVVIQLGVPMLLVAVATLFLMETGGHGLRALLTSDRPGGGDARWLVPIRQTSTRWEHFTMFSFAHLREVLNEQMLVAPIVLPTLAIIGIDFLGRRGKVRENTRLQRQNSASINTFLAVAAVSYWLFIWLWNPDYGGQRDWDLFSLAALPATLWLATLWPRTLPVYRDLWGAAAPLIVVQGLHTAAWIYQNTLPWSWP